MQGCKSARVVKPYDVMRGILTYLLCMSVAGVLTAQAANDGVACGFPQGAGRDEWRKTDITQCEVDYRDFLSGGPGRDDIPPIDDPRFVSVASARLAPTAPVIEVVIAGEARAYPLAVMMWHEIVNDVIGDMPVLVTYCPLCNAALVFSRYVRGAVLDFGTTGYLRHSDLVMYDRQTESWWQQYGGRGVLGAYSGAQLTPLGASLVSFEIFKTAHPNGQVLVPNNPVARAYGVNPYRGYDRSGFPTFYRGQVPPDIAPLARVVVAGDKAWTLDYIRNNAPFIADGLQFDWQAGQNSALDTHYIDDGRDVGTVRVRRINHKGDVGDHVAHHITFAFVVHAFEPTRQIINR